MTQSIARTSGKITTGAQIPKPADFTERRIRRISSWILLYLLLQTELGLAWDREWHTIVGRDKFLTPPHILMYIGIGGAGLLALILVLTSTVRYWRKAPGVDDTSTVSIFRFFHAPLGIIITGFGALISFIAAPLDNYWHQLYGIDITLWTPFHIMGTIGGILAGIGLLYTIASEAAIDRQSEHPSRRFLGFSSLEWGMLILISAFLELSLPSLTAFPPIVIGSFHLLTYPLPLAIDGAMCLVGTFFFTRQPRAAIFISLLVIPHALFTETFVPWAIRVSAAQQGLTFRAGRVPIFSVTTALLPLVFIASALFAYYLLRRHFQNSDTTRTVTPRVWLAGAFVALPAAIIPPCIVLFIANVTPMFPLPLDVYVLQPTWLEVLVSLPLAAIAGALGAILAAGLGDIWHWSTR